MYIQGLEHGTLSLVRVPCRLESLGTQSRDWTEVPAASVFVGVCVCRARQTLNQAFKPMTRKGCCSCAGPCFRGILEAKKCFLVSSQDDLMLGLVTCGVSLAQLQFRAAYTFARGSIQMEACTRGPGYHAFPSLQNVTPLLPKH